MGVKNVLAMLRRAHPADARLSAVADGTADAPERARVEAHAAECARCSARVGEYRAVRAMLAAVPMDEAPRSFRLSPADAREALVPRQPVRASRPLAMRAVPALAAASVVAFAALVGADVLGVGGGATDQPPLATLRQAPSTSAAGGGQEKSLAPQPSAGAPEPALADGAGTPEGAIAGYDAASGTPGAAAPPMPRSAGTSATPPASTPRDSGEVAGGATPGASRNETEQPASGGARAIRWAEAGTAALALLSGIAGVVLWRRREEGP